MNGPDKRAHVASEPDRAKQGYKPHLRNGDDSEFMITAEVTQSPLYEIEDLEMVRLNREACRKVAG